MASIISSINWVANGERADSVTINRPLLEFITKYETGDITLSTDSMILKIDTDLVTAAGLSDYDLIAYNNAGVLEKADSSNKDNIIGIIINNGAMTDVYVGGLIDTSFLVPVPTAAQEKYYLDETLGNKGKLTNSNTGSNLYIGRILEVDTGSYKFLIEFNSGSNTLGGKNINFGVLSDSDLITYDNASDTFINTNNVDGGIY